MTAEQKVKMIKRIVTNSGRNAVLVTDFGEKQTCMGLLILTAGIVYKNLHLEEEI